MASCDVLDFGLIQEYYLNNISDADIANPASVNLCCYSSLPMTYDAFVTGVTSLYNQQCLRDREYSDYITQLFTECLSGSTGGVTKIIAGTNITISPTSGLGDVTINSSGSGGGYWSGNTDGTISNSGLTSSNVGIGTHVPSEMLSVSGNTNITNNLYVSGNTYWPDNGQAIFGNGGDLSIIHNSIKSIITNTTGELLFQNDADNADIRFKGTDDTSTITSLTLDMSDAGTAIFNHDISLPDDGQILLGTGSQFILEHNSTTNLIKLNGNPLVISTGTTNPNSNSILVINTEEQVGIGTQTGNTTNRLHVSGTSTEDPVRFQTVQDGKGYVVVIDDSGVLYKTTSITSGDTAGYWTGNTDGSISNSGLTSSNIGIGTHVPSEMLSVSGNTNITQNLYVTGNTFYEGTLSGTGSITTTEDIAGTNITASNNLYVTGNTFYEGALSGTGNITTVGDVYTDQVRRATDNSTTTKINLSSSNIIKLFAGNSSNEVMKLESGNVSLPNTTNFISSGNLYVTGNTFYEGALSGTGNITTTDSLLVSGDTYFGSTVDVGVDATGHDVTFYSNTTDRYLRWDTSRNALNFTDETRIEMGAADFSLWHDASTNIIRLSSWPLVIRTGTSINDTVMVINSEQQVGIGTYSSSTTNRLHVSGTSSENPVRLQKVQEGEGYIMVIDDSGVVYKTSTVTSGDTAGYWTGNTDGSISPSGLTTNVGIGTSTPTGLFEVKDLIKFPETNSTFIGEDSGANWESGSVSNTALGRLSMGLGTMSSAVQNTAIGFASLGYITSGDYNTALGLQSNQSISTASWNTSIGTTSMFGSTYHSKNTAVGANTLYFTTSGGLGKTVVTDTHNTAIGYSSQYYNLNGAYNTSVGSLSIGNGTIAYAGTGSTAIGYRALWAQTTGSYNTGFGYQAGDNITTGDYNISIGPDSDPPSATADYQMNIGNIIYGNDEYSESKIANVGIGYNDPKTVLDVHHSGNDLARLAANTGGGEVIYFGTNDEEGAQPLAAGKLMYLHTDNVWYYADADAVGSGGYQLLAIALGTLVSDGLLIRGFFSVAADAIEGTYDEGLPCYVSEEPGAIDFTAPSASGDFIRVVGYAISNTSEEERVIYFNPGQTWVELT